MIKRALSFSKFVSTVQLKIKKIEKREWMHDKDFFQPIQTTNNLLLMADTDKKMTNNFSFLYLKNKFITCSLCTPEA